MTTSVTSLHGGRRDDSVEGTGVLVKGESALVKRTGVLVKDESVLFKETDVLEEGKDVGVKWKGVPVEE